MIRYLLVCFSLLATASAVEVNYPKDWEHVEVPWKAPEGLNSFVKISPPDRSVEVTVVDLQIRTEPDTGAADTIRGMSKGGFVHRGTALVEIKGFPGRRLSGTFPLPDGAGVVEAQTLLIFLPSSTISVAIAGKDPSGLENEVLSWIVFPTPEKMKGNGTGEGSDFWYHLGTYSVLGAVVFAIVGGIRARKLEKAGSAKGMKS